MTEMTHVRHVVPSQPSPIQTRNLGGGTVRRKGKRLVDAFKDRDVLIGFTGALLIFLGSLTPAYLPANSPWWRFIDAVNLGSSIGSILGTITVLVGIGLLVLAWVHLRPGEVSVKNANPGAHRSKTLRVWAPAVLLIWSLPFLLAPPIFSHDAYSYAAQGWLLHNNIDPYYAGPGVLPGSFADQVSWVWRFTPAPYGPLSLRIACLLVEMVGFNPYWAAVAQRIPALLGVVLIVIFLPRLAAKVHISRAFTYWFVILNPLFLIDFVGGAHNDSLMMGLVVVGLWLGTISAIPGLPRRPWMRHCGWILGALMIGVAASVKQPALLAAPAVPLILFPWRRWRWHQSLISMIRILTACALALGSFAAVSIATDLNFGWFNAVDVPGRVTTVSPFTLLGQGLQIIINRFGLDPTGHMALTVARSIGWIIAAVAILWLAFSVGRRRPLAFVSLGYLVVAICSPALHSWYLLWGGVLVPFQRPKPTLVRAYFWGTILLLCYAGINLSWRNGSTGLGIVGFLGLCIQSIWYITKARHEK